MIAPHLVFASLRTHHQCMNTKSLLGETPVHRIGFGAMQLAGPGVFGPPRDPEEAKAVLRRALELGADHIDTSQYYGPDIVNELIRDALYPYPEDLKLVTKVGGRRDSEGGWLPAQSPPELRAGVEENLRTLQVERMDLVNLRIMPGTQVQLAEQLGELEDMRREGKLDLIGVSTVDADQLTHAIDLTDIACVQNPYSLVNRGDEPVLEMCIEHDIAYVPYFPLGSAFIGGPKQLAQDPAIAEVAERRGVSAVQIALAWLLHRSERILLIAGTSSIRHLEENMVVIDIELDAEDLQRLEQATPIGNPMAAAEH